MNHKPNILMILVDQMRGDAMGCAGNPLVQTPTLDRLATPAPHRTKPRSLTS